jgi:hypothetical protein
MKKQQFIMIILLSASPSILYGPNDFVGQLRTVKDKLQELKENLQEVASGVLEITPEVQQPSVGKSFAEMEKEIVLFVRKVSSSHLALSLFNSILNQLQGAPAIPPREDLNPEEINEWLEMQNKVSNLLQDIKNSDASLELEKFFAQRVQLVLEKKRAPLPEIPQREIPEANKPEEVTEQPEGILDIIAQAMKGRRPAFEDEEEEEEVGPTSPEEWEEGEESPEALWSGA